MKKPIIAFATAILILASCGESKSFAYSGEPGMELSSKDEWYNSFGHWNDVTADISTYTSYYVASGSERDDYEVSSESTFKINWRGEADIEVTTTSNGTTSTTEAYVRRESSLPSDLTFSFASTVIADGKEQVIGGRSSTPVPSTPIKAFTTMPPTKRVDTTSSRCPRRTNPISSLAY